MQVMMQRTDYVEHSSGSWKNNPAIPSAKKKKAAKAPPYSTAPRRVEVLVGATIHGTGPS